MPTFYISDLSQNITSDSLELPAGSDTGFLTGYGSSVCVSLSKVKNMFQWHTDSLVWTADASNNKPDDSDIKFKIVGDVSGEYFGMNLNALLGDVDLSGVYVDGADCAGGVTNFTNRALGLDYLRRQSYHYFKTVHAVDLFNNEQNVITDLQTDFSTSFKSTLAGLAEYNEERVATYPEVNGGGALVCKKIFDQIIKNHSSRFKSEDASGNTVATIENVAGSDYWFQFNFAVGDIIAFNLTINSHANQGNLSGLTSNLKLAPQTYLIRLTVI